MSIQSIPSSLAIRKTAITDRVRETAGNTVFKEVFEQAASSSFAGAQTPLSKQEIMEIVSIVRAQMNARITRLMSAEQEDTLGLPRSFMFALPGQKCQEPSMAVTPKPDRDAFKGHTDLEPVIQAAAADYGVDPALIKSVIKVESNFNPNSTSPKGAMGLMQLMPQTARGLGVQNAYDPVENVRAGTRYLGTLLHRYDGNVTMALAAYNWGMGNLEKRPAQMPLETKNYIENVTRRYVQIKA